MLIIFDQVTHGVVHVSPRIQISPILDENPIEVHSQRSRDRVAPWSDSPEALDQRLVFQTVFHERI